MSGKLHAPVGLSSEKEHGTHWTGGLVGFRTGMDTAVAKREKSLPQPSGP
jgi:hypothetical protein